MMRFLKKVEIFEIIGIKLSMILNLVASPQKVQRIFCSTTYSNTEYINNSTHFYNSLSLDTIQYIVNWLYWVERFQLYLSKLKNLWYRIIHNIMWISDVSTNFYKFIHIASHFPNGITIIEKYQHVNTLITKSWSCSKETFSKVQLHILSFLKFHV